MRTRLFALAAAAAAALAQVPAAYARKGAPAADWSAVQALTPGEKSARPSAPPSASAPTTRRSMKVSS